MPQNDWDLDKPGDISQENWDKLRDVYQYPLDIDLFPGGLAEEPGYAGGNTGHTFNCLIKLQAQNLMKGDRFFVSHTNQKGSFSTLQRNNLLRRRLSDVMCENTFIPTLQPWVLKSDELDGNERRDCGVDLRTLDVALLLEKN